MGHSFDLTEEYFKKHIDPLGGWLSYTEGKLLFDLAKQASGKGAIVEIGSWQGKSSICMGLGSKAGKSVPVYAVDPHTGSIEHHQEAQSGKVWTFDIFKKNITENKVDDVVRPLVKMSGDAAKEFSEPVEVIFIDGAHDYDNVKLDFDAWTAKLVVGGFVAFHDSTWEGVHRVLSDHLYNSTQFGIVRLADGTTYAQKVGQNDLLTRLINQFNLQKLNLAYAYKENRRKIRGQIKNLFGMT